MIEGIAVVLVSWLFFALGMWAWWSSWSRGTSHYERGAIFSAAFGRNARYGYDAGLPVIATLWGAAMVLAAPLVAVELMGHFDELPVVLLRFGRWLVGLLWVLGWLLGCTLLLFLWPKALAPPHLRNNRGWIPEWLHQRRIARGGR